MASLEKFCELLFEFSNEDRFNILLTLSSKKMNITNLSRVLELTTQEVSRHVTRLTSVNLIQRNSNGLHHLTPFGELCLKQLKGISYTGANSDYFSTHYLEALPEEFQVRLGELEDSTRIDNVMLAIHSLEHTLIEAEEYVWNINVPFIASAFPHIRNALDRGIYCRFLRTPSLTLPKEMMDERNRDLDDNVLIAARRSGVYEERFTDEKGIILYLSEKELGLLTFPNASGQYDFQGFKSKNKNALKLSQDIYNYYWEKASKNIE